MSPINGTCCRKLSAIVGFCRKYFQIAPCIINENDTGGIFYGFNF